MGKYLDQAISYNDGITKLVEQLDKTVLDLEKVKNDYLVNTLENKDALTYYVNEFNEDTLEETKNLISKCNTTTFLLITRAQAIDERIEMELRQAEEAANESSSDTASDI